LVPLFDGYRQFYRQASEPDRIRRFLLDRFEHNQSVIFIAVETNQQLDSRNFIRVFHQEH